MGSEDYLDISLPIKTNLSPFPTGNKTEKVISET